MKKLRIWFIGGMILGIRFLSIECPRNEARNHKLKRKVELLEQVYIFTENAPFFTKYPPISKWPGLIEDFFRKNPAFIETKLVILRKVEILIKSPILD